MRGGEATPWPARNPGEDQARRTYGRGAASFYYRIFGDQLGSAYFYPNVRDAGSSCFWRYGRTGGSAYFWRYGRGCLSETAFHRRRPPQPHAATLGALQR